MLAEATALRLEGVEEPPYLGDDGLGIIDQSEAMISTVELDSLGPRIALQVLGGGPMRHHRARRWVTVDEQQRGHLVEVAGS